MYKKFSWCVFRNWMFRMAIKLRGKRTYQIMEIYAYQIDWLFILQQDAITHHKIDREKSRLLCIHLFLLPIRDDDVWWCSNTNANLYVKTYDRKCVRPLWALAQKRYSKKLEFHLSLKLCLSKWFSHFWTIYELKHADGKCILCTKSFNWIFTQLILHDRDQACKLLSI